MKIITAVLILFLGLGGICFAGNIDFSISVDKRTVAIGEAVYLNLIFDGTQEIGALDFGDIEGFSVRYVGPSSKMSIVNGKAASSITHIYVLEPLAVGSFKVGPFSVEYKGQTLVSRSIPVEVVSAGEGATTTEKKSEGKELEDNIFLTIEPSKNEVYLNEIFDISIKLYINNLGVKNIQYPQISHNGFSLGQIKQPIQYRDTIGGRTFDVIEFKTQCFPTQIGQLSLDAVSLKCDILLRKKKKRGVFNDFDSLFGNFFGDYDQYSMTVNSPQISMIVLPLPQKGKLSSFSGAVGRFDFDVEVSPVEVNVGDPITLRMIVKGNDNFNVVKMPYLELDSENFKIYDPQITVQDNSKIFESVLIPLKDDIEYIPETQFSFFNPESNSYSVLKKGPFKISVKKADRAQTVQIVELSQDKNENILKSQELGRDIIYIKDSLGAVNVKDQYLYKNKLFLLFQVLPLVIFMITLKIYGHFHRIKTDIAYARRLRAPKVARKGLKEAAVLIKKNESRDFYEVIFKTLQRYLGYKLHIPWAGITVDIIGVLKNREVDEDILDKIKVIMSDCDLARYTSSGGGGDKMAQILSQLRVILDYLERKLK
ncbi:MAG: BatD family protein [Candidatus Omnitrophota bacterium]|nr:BatD family protein [Candidatus Omnitrophota bacterium]